MKIILVTESFGPKGFGVGEVLSQLVRLYRDNGISVKILAPLIEDPENLLSDYDFRVVPCVERKFLWHPQQLKFFEREIAAFKPNLIHIHGVYTLIQHSAIQAGCKAGVPLLLSSHGMLNPWLGQERKNAYNMMKGVYWGRVMKPALRNVDCVHAITRIEAACLEKEFPAIPQILIPNAIDTNLIPDIATSRPPDRKFVYLGRLHPKKGVHLLVRAFANNHFDKDWRLVIAGPDFDPSYGQMLRRLVAQLGLADRVDFIGPVYGQEKYALLAAAWTVVVPSYSEVVALVNLESAAVKAPTITTTNTGLHDWAESGGVLVEAAVEPLSSALRDAARWTKEDRLARGEQGRAFVRERYSWQTIGPRWIQAYNHIAVNRGNLVNKIPSMSVLENLE